MTKEMSQNVRGHSQDNTVNTKSNSFENCTFHGFTINIHTGSEDENQTVTFNSKSSGEISSSQTLQLPNDAATIIKVLDHYRDNGIEVALSLPENIKLPAIEQ